MSVTVGACASFDDLFQAANGRSMNSGEREALSSMTQSARNEWVRRQAARASGALWLEDRIGTDGIVYTAFGWHPKEQEGLGSDTANRSPSSDRSEVSELPPRRFNRA